MKAVLTGHIVNVGLTLRPIAVALFMLLMIGVTALIVIRQQCIQEGYEISRLAATLEAKTIMLEQAQAKYNDYLRNEVLIKRALDMGFEFPTGDKVFYVQ